METKCKNIFIAVMCLLTLFAGGCKSNDTDERKVLAVSIEPQRYMLQQIVGDDFNIVTLMPNGTNPETYEPSMSARMAVDKAAACFTTGYFPFESDLAVTSDNSDTFVDISQGIEPIYGTHMHGGEHHKFLHADSTREHADPHIWTSVRNARTIARTMYETVSRINPDKADVYKANYEKFDARLDSLDQDFGRRLGEMPHKSFLVWHPSLSYFARDYGLEQIAVGFEGKESSMKTMRKVITEARQDSVKVFFFQSTVDSRQAEAVNNGVGSRLVAINPTHYEWEKGMIEIVDELTKP